MYSYSPFLPLPNPEVRTEKEYDIISDELMLKSPLLDISQLNDEEEILRTPGDYKYDETEDDVEYKEFDFEELPLERFHWNYAGETESSKEEFQVPTIPASPVQGTPQILPSQPVVPIIYPNQKLAEDGALSLRQKYEKVEITEIRTSSQSTWQVNFSYPIPVPNNFDKWIFDSAPKADRRTKILLAYGLDSEIQRKKINGKTTYQCWIKSYRGSKPEMPIPIATGWDEGFEWRTKDNAVRRARGLRYIGYEVKLFKRGNYFQLKILSVPKIKINIKKLSRWHQFIKDTAQASTVPLVDGADIFKNMVEAIESASDGDYIYILGWMLDVYFEMVPHKSLKGLLENAAQKGVEIKALIWNNPQYAIHNGIAKTFIDNLPKSNSRMIIDGYTFGSPLAKKTINDLKGIISNVSMIFNTLQRISTNIDLNTIPGWAYLNNFVNKADNEGSHHEKILIVKRGDELTGFCGGADINPDRLVSSKPPNKQHHDIQCMVKDHAARQLLRRFIKRWEANPESSKFPLRGKKDQDISPGHGPTADDRSINNVKIVHTYNNQNNPSFKDRSAQETITTAIRNARRSIYMEDQYMVSLEIAGLLNDRLKDPEFKNLTILIQDDSLTSELLFPKRKRNEFIDKLYANRSLSERAKVSLKMLDPDDRLFPAVKWVHSKFYLIDKEDDPLAIIGSANCSFRSLTFDSETSVVIFSDTSTLFVDELNRKLKLHQHNWKDYLHNDPNYDDMDEKILKVINNKRLGYAMAVAQQGPLYEMFKRQLNDLMPVLRDLAWKFIEPQGP